MKGLNDLINQLPDADVKEVGICDKCKRRLYTVDDSDVVGCECDVIKESQDDLKSQKSKAFSSNSIITDFYREKRLNDYNAETDEQKHAKEVAKQYILNFDERIEKGTNLLFTGSFGTGKTHIAASIRNALVARNYKVFYISLPDYLTEIKRAFNDTEKQYVYDRMIKECDLLVLDDVGANRMTDFEVAELFKLVDSRTGKCTIYTTNLSSKDFNKTFDLRRAFSRMMHNTQVIVLNGADYRQEF